MAEIPSPEEVVERIRKSMERGEWDHQRAKEILQGLHEVNTLEEAEGRLIKTGEGMEEHMHHLIRHAFGEDVDNALRAWLVLAALHRFHEKGEDFHGTASKYLQHYEGVLDRVMRVLENAQRIGLDVSGPLRAIGAEVLIRLGPYGEHPRVKELLKKKFGL